MIYKFDPILGTGRDGDVSLAAQQAGFNAGPGAEKAAFQASVSQYKNQGVFYSFGDSISVEGGRVIDLAGAQQVDVYHFAWQFFAEVYSQGTYRWGGTFGFTGKKISELRAGYFQNMIDRCPAGSRVFFLCGQNDISGGTVNAQTLSDYEDMVKRMIAACLDPIICTLTPYNTSRSWQILNNFAIGMANKYGLDLCDFHGAVVDPATGLWKTALTRDGTHPSANDGAEAMGAEAGATLLRRGARKWVYQSLAKANAGYGPNLTTETGGTPNPLFLTDNGATPPAPTGWFVGTGGHATSMALASTDYGRKFTMTASSTELVLRNSSANTVRPGDVLRVSFLLSISIATPGAGNGAGFALLNTSGSALFDHGRYSSHRICKNLTRVPHVFYATHSGATGVLFDFSLLGNGNSATIEQFSVVNMTALGL